ncbi:MAG TPA: single-stranded-DNA-specific exonuclease RecJ [Terracidiphilus sp.]|nr:single-stranded-DNA-specific exonuclease RecJ [Terracidiphilus sp.]
MSTSEAAPARGATSIRPQQKWTLRQPDPAEQSLAGNGQFPPLLAQLLVARGIRTAADADRFLNPSLDHLHDPWLMSGMAAAVPRIQQAIAAREPILIYGDYDVDGTIAVVLLKTAIERLGGAVRFHVPHRLREGYGMQREILETAAREGVRLVISVDTGIRAFAAAEAAEALHLDLIVTDHHLPESSLGLPKALAILNPNQPGCAYPCKHLCGAGVAFKLSQALLEVYDRNLSRTRLLPSFLKLLAIATVADSVPLLDENRTIVALGIRELQHPVQIGLRALMQVAQVGVPTDRSSSGGREIDPAQRPINPIDIGFRLAPRINAAGRMDIASEVVELFTTRDASRAHAIAQKLEQLNQDRRNTEAAALTEILTQLDQPQFHLSRCLVIDGDGWHRGVLGILASRVVERTGKPTLILAHEDGEAHGSGRSIPGFHLLNAIESCRDLFTRFGGHAHAAGFSLPSDRVPELRRRLAAYAEINLSEADLGSPLQCDAPLPLEDVNESLYQWLKKLEPCGMDNEEPIFIATNLRIATPPRIMKEKHIRLQLGAEHNPATISAVGWNHAEKLAALQLQQDSLIDLAYKIRKNEHPTYGGIELEIVDFRPGTSS